MFFFAGATFIYADEINETMLKDKRFLPVEIHEPSEECCEDFDGSELEFYDDLDDSRKGIPRKRSLYVAS